MKRGASGPAPDGAPPLVPADIPDVGVDRRSAEPLRSFGRFVSGFDGRVVVVADGPGRRETLAQFLAEHGLPATLAEGWGECAASQAPLVLTHGPVASGFALPAERLAIVTEAELYPSQVRQSRRRDARGRTSAEGMLRDLAEVKEGDPVVHSQHGIGRYRGLVTLDLGDGPTEFLHLEYEAGDKLYVPVSQLHVISRYTGAAAEDAPVHRLGSGQWEKARRKAAQQVRDTAAELLDLYARRAARQGFAFPLQPQDYETFSAAFEFEETPDQASAIQAVIAGHDRGQAHGPPRLRRRGLRQDRGGHARRLRRRRGRQAGGDPRADDAARGAALRELQRPLRAVAGEDRRAVPVPQPEGDRRGRRGAGRRVGRHRHRHAPADPEGGGVQEPRPRHHRRGAPLRRAPEGEPQAPARRGGRPHPHRHAHPAHARHVARGAARLLRHRHGAAAAPRHQDVRLPPVARHHPRGGDARVEARRPGLLPLERGRHDREPARDPREAASRGAHRRRPRPDARARPRARDARLLPPEGQRPAVLDDHRDRHRRAHRQHDPHRPRRPLRSRPAAPAARARGPLAPPGLRLPAHAARGGPQRQRQEAPGGDPDDGGPGRGLLPRHARPRDPRRGRGAGRVAVGRHPRRGIRALHRDARARGEVAARRPRARPRAPGGRGHRGEPARPGPAAGGLLRRRARAARDLQAPGQLRLGRGPRAPDRGAGGPVRRPAGARPRPARVPPPAHPGRAPGRGADRRGPDGHRRAVRARSSRGRQAHHRAGAVRGALPAARAGPRAHRVRDSPISGRAPRKSGSSSRSSPRHDRHAPGGPGRRGRHRRPEGARRRSRAAARSSA